MSAGLPSVLMLHGAGGGGWEWRLWQAAFDTAGFGVDAPDLQPCAAGIAATTLDDYRRQAREAAARHRRPVVIGASLGGLLALDLAAAIECTAVVLINPLPPLPEAPDLPRFDDSGDVIHWRRDARLDRTRAAMPDADGAASVYAFRRWRDESAAVMHAACAGIELDAPRAPVLVIGSTDDRDVPIVLGRRLALRLNAAWLETPGGHIEPLLGSSASRCARLAVEWLNTAVGFHCELSLGRIA
jgi:pimeloyl-ACP methyl ester carboxylesterase